MRRRNFLVAAGAAVLAGCNKVAESAPGARLLSAAERWHKGAHRLLTNREALAPELAQNIRDYPWLSDPVARMSTTPAVSDQLIAESLVALYNPAQLDVFGRASLLARELIDRENEAIETDA